MIGIGESKQAVQQDVLSFQAVLLVRNHVGSPAPMVCVPFRTYNTGSLPWCLDALPEFRRWQISYRLMLFKLQDSCLSNVLVKTIVTISISSNLTLPNDARTYKRPGPGPTQGIMSSGSTHIHTLIGPKQTNMADS
jgi:hypothetical protein